jgi:hypothetical protein
MHTVIASEAVEMSSFRDGPKDQTRNLEILRGARGAP